MQQQSEGGRYSKQKEHTKPRPYSGRENVGSLPGEKREETKEDPEERPHRGDEFQESVHNHAVTLDVRQQPQEAQHTRNKQVADPLLRGTGREESLPSQDAFAKCKRCSNDLICRQDPGYASAKAER